MKNPKIIVLSDLMAEKIKRQNNSKKINQKIATIPSWADPDFIKPIDKEKNIFSQKYNLIDSFVLIYSGNQGRCHDIWTIMEAAENLKQEKRIKFLIIGNGAQQN